MTDFKRLAYAFDGCARLEIISAVKTKNGLWELVISVKDKTPTDIYEICQTLHGYNKDDFFSIGEIRTENYGEYICTVERITNSIDKKENM